MQRSLNCTGFYLRTEYEDDLDEEGPERVESFSSPVFETLLMV